MPAPSQFFLPEADTSTPMTMYGPDFPFAYDDWLKHPSGLGSVPSHMHGAEVAIIGAGMAGMTAAYELMKMGLKPVIYEAGRIGGRLRSQPFEGAEGIVAELGGMRFPLSSTAFYHYVNMLGIQSRPFPNPLAWPASNSTVIDLEGETIYVEKPDQLPAFFREIQECWSKALEEGAAISDLRQAVRARDTARVKEIWNQLVPIWDDRTFYDFVATSYAFAQKSFRHREVFGQVGFGTGGWDSDFPNSMLEILRVICTDCDENQFFMVGGVEQVPRGLWKDSPSRMAHWPPGTSLAKLHDGATRPAARHIARSADGKITVTDRWGHTRSFEACLVTVQSWVLTTNMEVEETLFSPKLWMALDRTRYMQSSKTFVMTDRPFWKDKDPETGRDLMSQTLTDRLTRGTYLFDNGDDKPGVICLSYSWMSDALKMLPETPEDRVKLCLESLEKIYPKLDLKSHIIGDPITVSWESDPNFLGAFKGALPGHYRYNRRMYCHFMQETMPDAERGIFMAGDGVSWTPGWVEGAVQTSLNAVWGIMHHLGGKSPMDNLGPGDMFEKLKPIELGE
jgi:tryptophan 2-monooxygenase